LFGERFRKLVGPGRTAREGHENQLRENDEIREWCRRALAPAFPSRGEVLFRAYLALVVHA
jgi:hypothetical protein